MPTPIYMSINDGGVKGSVEIAGREGTIEIIEIGLGQESQVAGVDRENRNPHRGGLPRGGKHRAVTPQHDGQHHRLIEALGHTGAVAAQAQVLIGVGKAHHAPGTAGPLHGMAGSLQALLNRVRRLHRQRLAVIDDQSDPGH